MVNFLIKPPYFHFLLIKAVRIEKKNKNITSSSKAIQLRRGKIFMNLFKLIH
jgi:hypothetical protein